MALDYGTGGHLTVSLEGPFGGSGMSAKLTEITLPAANWKGAESPYRQIVAVQGISVNSMVCIHPSVEQIQGKRIAFTAENEAGVVTVYAYGDKPQEDYTMQVSLMEVIA